MFLLHPQSELPYSKALIRESIEFLLLINYDFERRGELEVANIYLNDYIADEDYRSIYEQQAGWEKAFNLFEGKDVRGASQLIVDSSPAEARMTLERIQQDVIRESELTVARHRTIRAVVEATYGTAKSSPDR